MSIENLIIDLSHDPFNPDKNFAVACEYERLNQSASAVSFYLRTIEYSTRTYDLAVYTSLIKLARAFDTQKDRIHSVSHALSQAVVYLHLSKLYEGLGSWQDSYLWANLGLQTPVEQKELPAFVDYYGAYCLEFQKAIAAYWIGRRNESTEMLLRLKAQSLNSEYSKAVDNNLERLGIVIL
jgi:hypothetical protein